jgi:hypothetical protein
MKERFAGRVPALFGYDIQNADVAHGQVRLVLAGSRGTKEQMSDHVIAATGYRVDLRRLKFLSAEIVAQLRSVRHAPVLSASFESSIPGLYFVGVTAMDEFGPMMRFACGAEWTAKRLSRTFARGSPRRRGPVPIVPGRFHQDQVAHGCCRLW